MIFVWLAISVTCCCSIANTYFTLGLPAFWTVLLAHVRSPSHGSAAQQNARLFCFTMALGLQAAILAFCSAVRDSICSCSRVIKEASCCSISSLRSSASRFFFAHRHFHILFHFITFTTAAFRFLRQFRQKTAAASKALFWIEMLFGAFWLKLVNETLFQLRAVFDKSSALFCTP